jgi:hypothetical protein
MQSAGQALRGLRPAVFFAAVFLPGVFLAVLFLTRDRSWASASPASPWMDRAKGTAAFQRLPVHGHQPLRVSGHSRSLLTDS